jgi:hypothetical protein
MSIGEGRGVAGVGGGGVAGGNCRAYVACRMFTVRAASTASSGSNR